MLYIAGNLIALFNLGLDRENYAFFGKMIIRKVVAFILKIFTMQKKGAEKGAGSLYICSNSGSPTKNTKNHTFMRAGVSYCIFLLQIFFKKGGG